MLLDNISFLLLSMLGVIGTYIQLQLPTIDINGNHEFSLDQKVTGLISANDAETCCSC
jgi:hypothetical protein